MNTPTNTVTLSVPICTAILLVAVNDFNVLYESDYQHYHNVTACKLLLDSVMLKRKYCLATFQRLLFCLYGKLSRALHDLGGLASRLYVTNVMLTKACHTSKRKDSER